MERNNFTTPNIRLQHSQALLDVIRGNPHPDALDRRALVDGAQLLTEIDQNSWNSYTILNRFYPNSGIQESNPQRICDMVCSRIANKILSEIDINDSRYIQADREIFDEARSINDERLDSYEIRCVLRMLRLHHTLNHCTPEEIISFREMQNIRDDEEDFDFIDLMITMGDAFLQAHRSRVLSLQPPFQHNESVKYNHTAITLSESENKYIFGKDLTKQLNKFHNINYILSGISAVPFYRTVVKDKIVQFCEANNLYNDDLNKLLTSFTNHYIINHTDVVTKINYIFSFCFKNNESPMHKRMLTDLAVAIYNVDDGCQANIGNKVSKLALECYLTKNNVKDRNFILAMLDSVYNDIWGKIQNSAVSQNANTDLLGTYTNGLQFLSAFQNATFRLDTLHTLLEATINSCELKNDLDYYKVFQIHQIDKIDGLLESGELEELAILHLTSKILKVCSSPEAVKKFETLHKEKLQKIDKIKECLDYIAYKENKTNSLIQEAQEVLSKQTSNSDALVSLNPELSKVQSDLAKHSHLIKKLSNVKKTRENNRIEQLTTLEINNTPHSIKVANHTLKTKLNAKMKDIDQSILKKIASDLHPEINVDKILSDTVSYEDVLLFKQKQEKSASKIQNAFRKHKNMKTNPQNTLQFEESKSNTL